MLFSYSLGMKNYFFWDIYEGVFMILEVFPNLHKREICSHLVASMNSTQYETQGNIQLQVDPDSGRIWEQSKNPATAGKSGVTTGQLFINAGCNHNTFSRPELQIKILMWLWSQYHWSPWEGKWSWPPNTYSEVSLVLSTQGPLGRLG